MAADAAVTSQWKAWRSTGRAKAIELGTGISGTLQSQHGLALVRWQEGDWIIEVTDSGASENKIEAQGLVSFLHTHVLPKTRGVMVVDNAGDGPHVRLYWPVGTTVYQVSDHHSARGAIEMALSMRTYLSGNMPSMEP